MGGLEIGLIAVAKDYVGKASSLVPTERPRAPSDFWLQIMYKCW